MTLQDDTTSATPSPTTSPTTSPITSPFHRRAKPGERNWSAEDRINIEKMLRDGCTYSQISVSLFGNADNRSAVGGFIKRAGLVGVSPNTQKSNRRPTIRPKKPAPRPPRPIRTPLPPKPSAAEMILAMSTALIDYPFAVSFDDLGPYHCHWPIGPDSLPRMFCGATAVIRGHYCRVHREIGREKTAARWTGPKKPYKTWR